MVKKSFFKRNEVKVGFLALGFIILFGIAASITDTFVTGIDTVSFTIPVEIPDNLSGFIGQTIPLELFDNRAIDCRIWVQGDIVDVGGGRTDIGFSTGIFNPQFQLDVINARTEREVSSIETEIRIRCDPIDESFNFLNNNNYRMTGGQLTYHWEAVDRGTDLKSRTDDTNKDVTQPKTITIQPSNEIIDFGGGGVTIASPKVSGTEIDNALTSPLEIYFSNVLLVIDAKPEFHHDLTDKDETAIVSLTAGVGPIKVFNQLVDPPKPTSQEVIISKIEVNDGKELFSDSTNIDLEVRIRLPQCPDGACGSPRVDLFKPTSSSVGQILKSVPLTAKKLVEASTNTYEFFDTNIEIPNNPPAGNWVVKASHDVRTGTDVELFTVLERDNQGGGGSNGGNGGNGGQDPRDNGDDPEGMTDFLAFGQFIECLKVLNTQGTTCLNASEFLPIYGIVAIIVLLAVVGGRR